jgi:hypothetical protein
MTQELMSAPTATGLPGWGAAAAFDGRARVNGLALRLSRTIGVARALVRGGRQLDLTGIDDGVGLLCAKILDLPDQEARTMLPALLDVLGQVEALQAALRISAEPSC